ncbi:hypothetical protein ACUUL3_09835 [Thiovibrio sp. JS02]
MKNLFFPTLLSGALFFAAGCASVQVAPTDTLGPDVYLISGRGTSRKILAETVNSAHEYCGSQDRHYLFVKNIFKYERSLGIDLIAYDLYFSCVEAGDPRLKERKGLVPPAEGKRGRVPDSGARIGAPEKDRPGPERGGDSVPAEKAGTGEKPAPAKTDGGGKEPAPAGTREPAAAQPVPAGEKSEISLPRKVKEPLGMETVPAPEPSGPGKGMAAEGGKTALTSPEEQLRKKNPGPGEPEDLRKDGAPLNGADSPIIEEVLPQ